MTGRTVFTGGLVFDGSGSPAAPGEVVVEGNRLVDVRPGHHPDLHTGHTVVDATGCTVMPGPVESHAHLPPPSAVGHIDPVTTAAELDQMTPQQRHEHFLASLVADLSELPVTYVERLQRKGRELIASRD